MITDIFSSPDTKIPTSESTSNILSRNPIQSISLVQSLTMRFLARAKHKSTRQLCSSKFEAKHTCSITYSSSASIPCENPSEIMLYLAKVVFYLPPQVLFQVHSLQQQQIYLFPRISPLSVTPPQTHQMETIGNQLMRFPIFGLVESLVKSRGDRSVFSGFVRFYYHWSFINGDYF